MVREDPATERSDETPLVSVHRKLVLRSILPGKDNAFTLTGESTTLGRGEGSDIVLAHEGVSRRHAELESRGAFYWIRDTGSTNGTFVNGTRVHQAVLAPGAVIRLGEWLGTVEEEDSNEVLVSRFGERAPGLWGGAAIARTLGPLAASAGSNLPVVLVGRTGTGKERFARALHCHDGAERPFHAINCAALPPPLVEAELFGYRKGAFTGAERSHAGHLLAAHGGTLFLDEVAELELPVQAKLLRALETGEIPRLGETGDRRFQARIVAACQVPLTDLVAARRFRDDLAARLSGLIVTVPALCDRRADVPPLFDIFLRRYSGGSAPPVSTRLYETLCLYSWPGNVRELELLARQLLAIHGLEPILRRSHLPATMRESGEERISQSMPTAGAAGQLINALKSAGGNVKKAATIAGMSRQRAYRLIQSERLASMVAASRGERGGESGRHD